jgi:hypothetical protein
VPPNPGLWGRIPLGFEGDRFENLWVKHSPEEGLGLGSSNLIEQFRFIAARSLKISFNNSRFPTLPDCHFPKKR